MAGGERTRLLVVAGLDRAATEIVCHRLMHAEPGVVVVHHDLRGLAEGVVHRRVRSTSSGNGWTVARVAAVLDRLVPGAPRARLDTANLLALVADLPPSARRGEVDDAHAPLLRGAPPLESDCGVTLTLFTDRRPFHPQRLHEAIDVLLDGVVHTKGRAWVASQPDVALWLESAGGGLRVGHAGAWLATADDNTWDRVDAQRRPATRRQG